MHHKIVFNLLLNLANDKIGYLRENCAQSDRNINLRAIFKKMNTLFFSRNFNSEAS